MHKNILEYPPSLPLVCIYCLRNSSKSIPPDDSLSPPPHPQPHPTPPLSSAHHRRCITPHPQHYSHFTQILNPHNFHQTHCKHFTQTKKTHRKKLIVLIIIIMASPFPHVSRHCLYFSLTAILGFFVILSLPHPVLSQCKKSPLIFSFGDSNSDTGGLVAGLGFPVNPPNGRTFFRRSSGRLSDGRLILDFLCKSVPLSLSHLIFRLSIRVHKYVTWRCWTVGVMFVFHNDISILKKHFNVLKIIFSN